MPYWILFFLFYSFSAFSLKESELPQVYKMLDDKNLYKLGSFKGENKAELRYLKFGKKKGSQGSVVFVSGRAENLFKYFELFYDLSLKGWSPVYVYDHRGQGFSSRLSAGLSLGYVDNPEYYKKDFEAFLRLAASDSHFNSEKNFLIAHSMGAAIAADYIQKNPKQSYFAAAVFSSPMIKMKIFEKPLIEHMLTKAIKLYCFFNCKRPAPRSLNHKTRRERLTGSAARYSFLRYLEEEKFPESYIGNPSLGWLIKVSEMNKKIMQKEKIKKIRLPILLLQAEKDLLVSNSHQDKFCALLPACCRKIKLRARHESFMEEDSIRDQAIKETADFFSNYKYYKKLCAPGKEQASYFRIY